MNTSCMPLASAVTWTGPRWCTTKPLAPANAGYRLGMTRICHVPSSTTSSSGSMVASSFPGQNGQGRSPRVSRVRSRGAKSEGRSARSDTIVTHRPFNGLRRICRTVIPMIRVRPA